MKETAMIMCDRESEIALAKNKQVTFRNMHIDVRGHHINALIQGRAIAIE